MKSLCPTQKGCMKRQAAVTAIAVVVLCAACFGAAATPEGAKRISLRMGDRTVTATLNDSDAANDLAAMVPLSIRMRDHLRREKTDPIPKPLSEQCNVRERRSGLLEARRELGDLLPLRRADDSLARNRVAGKDRLRRGGLRRPRFGGRNRRADQMNDGCAARPARMVAASAKGA